MIFKGTLETKHSSSVLKYHSTLIYRHLYIGTLLNTENRTFVWILHADWLLFITTDMILFLKTNFYTLFLCFDKCFHKNSYEQLWDAHFHSRFIFFSCYRVYTLYLFSYFNHKYQCLLIHIFSHMPFFLQHMLKDFLWLSTSNGYFLAFHV